jgi:hypothetical protein
MHPGPQDPARTGPFFTPANTRGEAWLGGIRRVVVLPVWSGVSASVETAASLDPVLLEALNHAQRFEVVALSRENALRLFRAESFSSASALPHGLMSALKRDFAADAVLFVDVTVYSAYRPLALGLRAKLATIDGTRLVWTFDNVFSADNAAVANAARNFYLDSDKSIPADMTQGVLQSPSRFAAYAGAAMFATLPPVNPPLPPRTPPAAIFKR